MTESAWRRFLAVSGHLETTSWPKKSNSRSFFVHNSDHRCRWNLVCAAGEVSRNDAATCGRTPANRPLFTFSRWPKAVVRPTRCRDSASSAVFRMRSTAPGRVWRKITSEAKAFCSGPVYFPSSTSNHCRLLFHCRRVSVGRPPTARWLPFRCRPIMCFNQGGRPVGILTPPPGLL